MTAITKSFHKFAFRFDSRAQRFVLHHPNLAAVVMFIGLPIFILLVVSAGTLLITLPISLLLGWA